MSDSTKERLLQLLAEGGTAKVNPADLPMMAKRSPSQPASTPGEELNRHGSDGQAKPTPSANISQRGLAPTSALEQCDFGSIDVGSVGVAKRTWYEKLLRILRKHQLSTCQRIEVAAHLGVQLVDVEEEEPKPPRRRGEKVWDHVELYVKVPEVLRDWLDDLKHAYWIPGGRRGVVCALLEYLRRQPGLVSEILGGRSPGRPERPEAEGRPATSTKGKRHE